MIKCIKLVGIWVSDQDRARDFYVDKLGFEVQTDITMPDGYRWLEVRPAGGVTAIAVAKPGPDSDNKPGGFTNIILDTDDIMATYQELKARGVEFVDLPEKQPWGWWGTLKDPDGNIFGLGQQGE
jgi:catechol 2,3-dioxygenase-like lactoylglutathione lyase family enzyme